MSYIKCQCNVALDEAPMRIPLGIQLGDCTSLIPITINASLTIAQKYEYKFL